MATTTSTPEAILEAVGGPGNIVSFTHCATRQMYIFCLIPMKIDMC